MLRFIAEGVTDEETDEFQIQVWVLTQSECHELLFFFSNKLKTFREIARLHFT